MGPRPADAAPGDDHGTRGALDQRGGAREEVRVGAGAAGQSRRGKGPGLGAGRGAGLAQHVGRDLDVDGAGERRVGEPDGRVNVLRDPRALEHRPGRLGDRPEDRDLIDILEGPQVELLDRDLAAEEEQRARGGVRGRQRRDGVGDAGPRRHAGDPGSLAEARVRVRHVHRRVLVPHVDDPHPRLETRVVDRGNVAAVQREQHLDTLAPELGDAEVAGVPGHRPAPNDR